MGQDPLEYLKRRERAERAAAKRSACPEARRVHQELAQRYAALANQQDAPVRNDGLMLRSGFSMMQRPLGQA